MTDTQTIGPSLLITDCVPCLYCFNLDHYVPVLTIHRQADARYCDICNTDVLASEWAEHQEHGALEGSVTKSKVCPVCEGFIPDTERVQECRYCGKCQSYVPVARWDVHQENNCFAGDDPFTEESKPCG